jgi:hypothetical protein
MFELKKLNNGIISEKFPSKQHISLKFHHQVSLMEFMKEYCY